MTKGSFIDFFGNYSYVKTIILLLENPEKRYTLKEIFDQTKGDYPIISSLISRLVKKGIIEEKLIQEDQEACKNGLEEKATLADSTMPIDSTYRIDTEHYMVKQFLKLDWEDHNSTPDSH